LVIDGKKPKEARERAK
jgi:hypothetical protein